MKNKLSVGSLVKANKIEIVLSCALIATLVGAVFLQPSKPISAIKKTESTPNTSVPSNSFAIVNVRLFDGEAVLENATVIVQQGLIAAVLKSGEPLPSLLSQDKNFTQINGTGKTLMPGLIDAHTHSWGNARRDALRFGVTTELEMMGDISRSAALKSQRASLARTDEADLWSAGGAVTVPGGHGTQFGLKVPTLMASDNTAEFVNQRVAEGSDFIKLIVEDLSAYPGRKPFPTLNSTQINAAIAAAQQANKLALVHVSVKASAAEVIAAGANGLVHIFADAEVDPAFTQLAKTKQVFVVPTLSVLASLAQSNEGANLAADPGLRAALSGEQQQSLNTRSRALARPKILARAIANVSALHTGGVQILAGTDAGNPGTAHGASMHGELALLVQAGMSPMQALAAATSKTANAFGLNDRGQIRAGLRADLLLVAGDPSANILATRQITHVWKNGYQIARDSAALLAPKVANDPQVGRFDIDTRAPFGAWTTTSDQMAGGMSIGDIEWVKGGALGTAGALQVSGEIKAGFAYPWAGAMFMIADAMAPVDASGKTELVFQVRGDGREVLLMLFSGESAQGIPISQSFKTTADWQSIKMPLADFSGAELASLRGLAWSADSREGSFEFWLDEVELR